MKTSELTRHALNWAVAQAEGDKVFRPCLGRPGDWDQEAYLKDGSDDRWVVRVQNPRVAHFVDWTYNPSGDWMQGGPIIEREAIQLTPDEYKGTWTAYTTREGEPYEYTGTTPLIAAMRCYVASKMGDEIEIPTELTKGESK
jgi:hypothetical protein